MCRYSLGGISLSGIVKYIFRVLLASNARTPRENLGGTLELLWPATFATPAYGLKMWLTRLRVPAQAPPVANPADSFWWTAHRSFPTAVGRTWRNFAGNFARNFCKEPLPGFLLRHAPYLGEPDSIAAPAAASTQPIMQES